MEYDILKSIVKSGCNLNNYETEVFLFILRKGEVKIGDFKDCVIPRSRIYDVAYELNKLGLISIIKPHKKMINNELNPYITKKQEIKIPLVLKKMELNQIEKNLCKNAEREYHQKIKTLKETIKNLRVQNGS